MIASFAKSRINYINKPSKIFRNIAILVPAYKEDEIIEFTITNLMKLDYPSSKYKIFLIADSFQNSTLEKIRNLPIEVITVSFIKSTKTKSLNAAFSLIEAKYDIALICDADNMLQRDFLQKINNAFSAGLYALQGKRVAKNLDSPFAILDACSEEINNHIFRKGFSKLNLSVPLIGSGMAFEYKFIKKILENIDSVGEDKILQLEIIKEGKKVYYLEDAIIFDEKISSSYEFEVQRKRWISTQFKYFLKYFKPAIRELLKGNFSYFNLSILANMVLPRSLLLLIIPILTLLSLFFYVKFFLYYLIILILFMFSLLISIPKRMINKDFLISISKLPKAIIIMFGTLLHIRNSSKEFIRTTHTKKEINNPFYNE